MIGASSTKMLSIGMQPKSDQLCCVVEKLWGWEEWIVNNEKYCGKKLVFKQGYRCSLHFHKIKEESFYVLAGTIYLELESNGNKTARIMHAGDVEHISIGVIHRITALTDAEVMEFSTQHFDEDSHRVEVASKVDEVTLNAILSEGF